MESGGSINASPANLTALQATYDSLVSKVKCSDSADSLQCLREVPFKTLNSVLNGTDGSSLYNFWPVVDGDLVQKPGSTQLSAKQFVKVPIIAGTNTDEGTAFGPVGINTTDEWYDYLTSKLATDFCSINASLTWCLDGKFGYRTPPSVANNILKLYPDDPSQGIPAFLGDQRVPSMGYEWRRTSAFAGDFAMHANRRRQCEAWAETSTPAYCYRFNVRSAAVPVIFGATHFEEVAFVFNNIAGQGYHGVKPFDGMPQTYVDLSNMMTSMWASFIHDLNPNAGPKIPVHWETYGRGKPTDLLFNANTSSYMEADTWRKGGIDYINSVAQVFSR